MTQSEQLAAQLRRRGIRDERVLAAIARVPRHLFVPVGSLHDQRLEIVVRGADGPERRRSVPCRFVPLVGAAGFDEERAG